MGDPVRRSPPFLPFLPFLPPDYFFGGATGVPGLQRILAAGEHGHVGTIDFHVELPHAFSGIGIRRVVAEDVVVAGFRVDPLKALAKSLSLTIAKPPVVSAR